MTAARVMNSIAILALMGPVYGIFLLASLELKGTLHDFPEEAVSMEAKPPIKFEKQETIPKLLMF